MPLVNGCTFPLKKVKASTFAAVAAQINPTTSEKIDAAASAWRAKQKKHCSPYVLSHKSQAHTATLSSIQADPTKLASKEEGILTFRDKTRGFWVGLVAIRHPSIPCLQLVSKGSSELPPKKLHFCKHY